MSESVYLCGLSFHIRFTIGLFLQVTVIVNAVKMPLNELDMSQRRKKWMKNTNSECSSSQPSDLFKIKPINER
jgi:hypothetical protein